ncbi:cupin domain-containing protein [Rhodoferax sp.]|uniref:cupin domain-containing protein n=1 Tax=Rhodoferax sp. TaxID=50421 RepID=UPI00374D071A
MSDGQFDVGGRLRQVRSAAGWSQRQLAERAGVPPSQISTIEQNKSSPSVASLRKILSGLPLTMAEFFEPDQPLADSVFHSPADLVDLTSRLTSHAPGASGDRTLTLRQVGNARAHNLQILQERYEPGADTGIDMLEHASHEGGIVLSGEIELTVGDQVKLLKPGDAYLFDSSLPHRFRNTGQRAAEIISACTPPYL